MQAAKFAMLFWLITGDIPPYSTGLYGQNGEALIKREVYKNQFIGDITNTSFNNIFGGFLDGLPLDLYYGHKQFIRKKIEGGHCR